MKLGIILGVIIGVVITAIAAIVIIVLVIFPASRQVETESTPITSPLSSVTRTTPPISTTTPSTTTPSSKPTGTTTASLTATNVNFDLIVPNVSISGITSATITSRLSNTGTSDAHNTWAKVEVFYQGTRLQIQGQDYFRQEVGLLKARETREIPVTITFSPLDALKILQNGATFILTLYSDEKSQSMSYDYIP